MIENLPEQESVRVVVLNLVHVNTIDVSGLEVLEEQAHLLHKSGKSEGLVGSMG